jgi:hypothetical protein
MSVRRSHEELRVLTKTYELILWSCHHTGKFPRHHRFVLGERMERNLYDLLETLIGGHGGDRGVRGKVDYKSPKGVRTRLSGIYQINGS